MEQQSQLASEDLGQEQPDFVNRCRWLKHSIERQRQAASFTCGGTILVGSDNKEKTEPPLSGVHSSTSAPCPSSPVSILWATCNDSTARKLVLPLDGVSQESSTPVLQQLVADCDPATFGRGQEDILDTEYRKAGKMDHGHFATSFHPADFGIIENVERILLPSISTATDNQMPFRKLTAELYKLNAYSGPSGLFRKHVDTPRSKHQIGSLVVCLPSAFQGGDLVVQHNGQTVVFDWSMRSSNTIQWAAFYSDCEHEIKQITSGDRITLTYNLFVTEPVGGAFPLSNGIINPKTLPLYSSIETLVGDPSFMEKGGVLGIYCSHAYPHSSSMAEEHLPGGLKGSDVVLYSIFESLGIEVSVLPVLEIEGEYNSDIPSFELKLRSYTYPGQDLKGKSLQGNIGRDRELLSYDSSASDLSGDECVERRWRTLFFSRRVCGIQDLLRTATKREISTQRLEGALVGTGLHEYDTTTFGQDMEPEEASVWRSCHLPGITWITEPKHQEMAFSYIAYGNEASIGTQYSCAAILAVIPPFDRR
ncbi:hypothetical protein ASPZODRAFT_76473 [Penicilliopsis zonata CBS 506.65]|uniref:Fe2OG dioxygenase domain-containing protein n=1 Tax=Penicilliopsis zonata CBS 506.65 TaxID=1073090 RepID=A0A1L9S5V9_9EURO|nr:hypothetical protein ASPZODRAFT_76473 [Penicilliopsis zonata CBS 506.65]OJJ42556.1 hypothetical protein ASPZODRAFT_76473 [Penicilliopsis zonata CBS 506.65]